MIRDGHKHCPQCNTLKPVEGGWYKNRARRDGLQSNCAECMDARTTAWAKTNPDKHVRHVITSRDPAAHARINREHYARNRDAINARRRARRAEQRS